MSVKHHIKCGSCESTLAVPERASGKNIRCPNCQKVIAVPVLAGRPETGNAAAASERALKPKPVSRPRPAAAPEAPREQSKPTTPRPDRNANRSSAPERRRKKPARPPSQVPLIEPEIYEEDGFDSIEPYDNPFEADDFHSYSDSGYLPPKTKRRGKKNPVEFNPYAAPTTTGHASQRRNQYEGIRRLPYFLIRVGITLAHYAAMVLVFVIAASARGQQGAGVGLLAVILLLSLAVFGGTLFAVVKRLQNMGYSGWWCLGYLVPLLNILVEFKCLAAPEGYAHHKKLDTAGNVIAGIFLSLFALTVIGGVITAIVAR